MKNDYESLTHTKWRCQYHIVITPKYRRQIIYGRYKAKIGKILRTICERYDVEILEAQGHLRYKVELNSCTGEITKTEVFEFEALGGDVDYKLKLY